MNWENHFPLMKMGLTHWEFYPYRRIFDQKVLKIFTYSLCIYIVFVHEIKRVSVNIISCVQHYLSFSQDFVDNSHFG